MFSGGRIPIRIYVGGLFIVLTLAIGLSMAALFYARMKSTVMVMSNDLFDRTATLVAADVAAQRSQIAVSLGFAARSELARATTLAARLRALDVLGETLEANPWVVAAYVGYPDGNFLLVRRRPEVRTSIGNVPLRTQFLVQSIDRSTGAPRGEYLFYDARLQQIAARAAPEYRFDPRSRPWYAAAGSGGVAVTAPYVFFTTRQIGITMSLRSAAQSVFGADIDLGNISDELASLRPTPGSLAAIVGRDGALLAYSDPAAFAQTTAGAGRAPVLTALGSPALAAAFANAGPAMHAEGQYHDPAGRWWIFRVTPVLAGVGTPRALLLAVPADELYADANRAIAAATLLGVVLLALWVPCALWLARLIARPLIVLREGAQALRNRDFSDDHKPPASMIAEIHELADTFVAMRRHVREHHDAASRFVPHAFLEQLERADIVSLELGDHAERNMTILFSDIRSFTTLSESMSPQQTFNFVNSYLTRVGPIIRNHRGFIDKYIGDAIMGLFPERPVDAMEAAVAMQRRVVVYNEERARAGYAPIAIGIGLHMGDLMLGTIGESLRFETTVIADAVNVAARLESLTKTFGSLILASGQVIGQVDRASFLTRRLGDVQVVGTSRAITLIEVCDADPPSKLEHKQRTAGIFERARRAYAVGDFAAAHELFAAVVADDETDKAAAYFRDRAATMAAATTLSVWDGVERMESK